MVAKDQPNKERELIEYKGQPAYRYPSGCIKHAETGRFLAPAEQFAITSETASDYQRLWEQKKIEAKTEALRVIGDIPGYGKAVKRVYDLTSQENMTAVKALDSVARAAGLLEDRRQTAAVTATNSDSGNQPLEPTRDSVGTSDGGNN